MKVSLVPIETVIPYARNPRKNDGAAVAKVAASLKEFGFRQPIVVGPDNVVIVGHTRLKAAQSLGLQKVPVHVADNLTAAQVKAYRIADNRVAEESDWDSELLTLEIADLQLHDFDLELTGLDPEELDRALTAPSGNAGDFQPNLAPAVGSLAVTDAQVDRTRGEMEQRFEDRSRQNLVKVTCPHCAGEFSLNADAL